MSTRVRRGLKPDEPLLGGHLVILEAGLRSTAPHLGLDAWCPWCKREPHHGWEVPPFRLDAVSHRVAHCPGGPFDEGGGYWVGLDPSPAGLADHRRVIREFASSLDRRVCPPYARLDRAPRPDHDPVGRPPRPATAPGPRPTV